MFYFVYSVRVHVQMHICNFPNVVMEWKLYVCFLLPRPARFFVSFSVVHAPHVDTDDARSVGRAVVEASAVALATKWCANRSVRSLRSSRSVFWSSARAARA